MKLGQPQDVILNYSSLYKLNPETARTAVLEVFKQTKNISKTARCFNTTRKVVQLAIRKEKQGSLADLSHARKTYAHKTPDFSEKFTYKSSAFFITLDINFIFFHSYWD